MSSEAFMAYVSASAISSAALTAVVTNGFRKVLAGVVVLVAGFCPWLIIFAVQGRLRGDVFVVLGLYGATPLFCLAFFLYCIGANTPRREISAGAAITGMFASLGQILFWFHRLCVD